MESPVVKPLAVKPLQVAGLAVKPLQVTVGGSHTRAWLFPAPGLRAQLCIGWRSQHSAQQAISAKCLPEHPCALAVPL